MRTAGLIACAIGVGVTVLVATADPAEAARRRRFKRIALYAPPTASMVVDAKTGRVLHASNPDAVRHPASITKVMTLYLLFEQLERGRFNLASPLRVSANAASQAPSKLGLQPGETIAVEDAIKALVTKSANDAAVVIAENIAGSEEAFAQLMTRKAHAIGMSRTNYANASGLPNAEQITTARDLVTLGRAIQDRFPKYYPYFATRSFEYEGAYYGNHNRLLGRIEGIDGIKTGFVRASGFNLLTSARLDGRHIVAVVLGGRSGRSRDALMASLVTSSMGRAYAGARIAPTVGETTFASAERPTEILKVAASANPTPDEAPRAIIRLAAVRTADLSDSRPAPITTSSISPPRPMARPLEASAARPVAANVAIIPPLPSPIARSTHETETTSAPRSVAAYAPVQTASAAPARPTPASAPAATTTAVAKSAAPSHPSSWVIQLGATEDEAKANAVLARAKAKSRAVAKASPFTERITKDGATLWRARFAGFDSDEAQAACKALKRDGFNCFAARG
ncbi:MAG: D-alanyl-D-alanine carboxypeptidase [Beijerinckiaceae bacterium]